MNCIQISSLKQLDSSLLDCVLISKSIAVTRVKGRAMLHIHYYTMFLYKYYKAECSSL